MPRGNLWGSLIFEKKSTKKIEYYGQLNSNALAGNNTSSQEERQGGTRNAASRERIKSGEQSAERGGRTAANAQEVEVEGDSRRESASGHNSTQIRKWHRLSAISVGEGAR